MSSEAIGRRQVETALQKDEEQFQAIFSQAAVGIAQVGLDGNWLQVNNRFCEMLGYAEAELLTKTWADIAHPDDRDASLDGRRRLLAGEITSHSMEKRYVRRDGTILWGRLYRSLVRDHENQPRYIISVLEDISERIQAEHALRDSQQRLALALRAAQLGVWECDLKADGVVLSPRYREAYHRDPTSYADWLVLVHPDDREQVMAVASGSIRGTHQWDAEFRIVLPDGSTRWMHSYAIVLVDEAGQPTRMVGVSQDVTERKEAEAALRESEERFRSAFENATVGIYRTTPEGRIEMGNPALVRMLGYESFQALAERNLEQAGFEPEYSRAAFRETLERQGQVQALEAVWTRQDGSRLFVRESARCARDEAGAVLFYEGVVEDITERKQMEDALRQSQQKFAAAFHLGPTAMSIVDIENGNRMLDVNKGFEEASGYSREELLGRSALDLGIWAETDKYAQALSRFRTDGKLRDFEFRFRTKKGELRTGLISAEPMEINNRKCAITCTIDITRRKQVEAALRESEAKLTEAQRLTKVGSWELDVQTQKIRWSTEMFRIYGFPIGREPDFQTFLTFIHPNDREKIMEAQAKAASGQALCDTEFRFIRPDGDVVFVRATLEALRDEHGILSRFRGATQDITERVKANESLRESERRLSYAERIAHVGHWDWDIETDQVSWSAEMLRILQQRETFTPSLDDLFQIIATQDRNRMRQWIADCLRAKRGSSIDVQIMRADGTPGTLSIISEIVLDEEGRPVRMFGSCQDVTESRRAQEELFARQKLESLGTLASGIAHDFNNLLGAVLAQAELAMAENDAGSDSNEPLREIRNVAIRGSEIVRQLMIYAGKESDKPEAVDISKVVEEMFGLLKASVSKHAILVTDLGTDLPAVTARGAQLRQIMINLVVNASEAIGNRDGVIRLTTRCVNVFPRVGESSEGLAAGDYVQLEVSDTGRGVPPEVQARMFDPFFSTKSAGRGLGLAVVQGIIRSLHGEIRVASDPATGTSFQILLPCASAATHAGAGEVTVTEKAAEASREVTILMVEDEDPLRLAARKMLGKAGFEVLDVANGCDAVELLRTRAGKIDLLLLDATIPGFPSHEVLTAAVEAQPGMKIILTSAYAEEMVKATLSAAQVRGFVRKPFQLGDLVRIIRDVLAS